VTNKSISTKEMGKKDKAKKAQITTQHFDVVDVDVFRFFRKSHEVDKKRRVPGKARALIQKVSPGLVASQSGCTRTLADILRRVCRLGFCKKKKKGEKNSSELSSTDTLLMIVVSRGFPRGSGHLQRRVKKHLTSLSMFEGNQVMETCALVFPA
jgi:hypothetical protein